MSNIKEIFKTLECYKFGENVMNKLLLSQVLLLLAFHTAVFAENIDIVGSSTVYPFSTVVAEVFGQTTNNRVPKVEATGSGGGMQLFCSHVSNAPAITNSSRQIKQSEKDLCCANGISGVAEIKMGYDGIVVAHSINATAIALTRKQLFLALARTIPNKNGALINNPYHKWSEIDASLPDTDIQIYGPPPTSGTRDSFVELVMEQGGCATFPSIKAIKKSDKNKYKAICHSLREDNIYIESGENDNLIIQKLTSNEDALGIFGYNFLEQNREKVKSVALDGIEPNFATIADGQYPVARPLFFYVNQHHYPQNPQLKAFVEFFVSADVMGEDGILADRGLIPLPEDEYQQVVQTAQQSATNSTCQ